LADSSFRKLIKELEKTHTIQIVDVLDKGKTSEKRELCYRITADLELPELPLSDDAKEEIKVAVKQKLTVSIFLFLS